MALSNAERQKAYRGRQRNGGSVTEGERNERAVTEMVWPEGSSFEPAEGVHCERCQYPAGRFTPPLSDRTGYRVLGSDPRGWHPDHGPDVGLGCCRTLICYDARPGHRVWM